MTNFRSEEARFVAWLTRGLRRHAGRLARKARHQRQREILMLNQSVSEDNAEAECLDLVPSSVDVYKQAEERMLMQIFHTCMSELTLLQQKVVQAVFLEGVTEQDMAGNLELASNR